MYVDQIVVLPALPVLDNMKFQRITFGVYEPTGETFAELRCWSTSSKDSDLPGEDCTLRLYESADQFHDDYCADRDAAIAKWTLSQKNEQPRVPEEVEDE